MLDGCYQLAYISSILKMEERRSSETSVFARPIRRHITEDDILPRKHNVSETKSVYVFR
jgi:hypothetical protein